MPPLGPVTTCILLSGSPEIYFETKVYTCESSQPDTYTLYCMLNFFMLQYCQTTYTSRNLLLFLWTPTSLKKSACTHPLSFAVVFNLKHFHRNTALSSQSIIRIFPILQSRPSIPTCACLRYTSGLCFTKTFQRIADPSSLTFSSRFLPNHTKVHILSKLDILFNQTGS